MILEKLGTPNIISRFISENTNLIKSNIHLNNVFALKINEYEIVNNKKVYLKCDIKVNLKQSDNYGGNLNHKLCIDSNFERCEILLNLPVNFNIDIVIKTLTHEITHIYELYQIRNIFSTNRKWNINFNEFEIYSDFDILIYFRDLVYTSLRHEVNAKISSISVYLRQFKSNDISFLIKKLEETNEWSHYRSLENFNPDKYLKDLLNRFSNDYLVTIFNYFNKVLKIEKKISDILSYFKKFKKYFSAVCKEWKKKMFKIIFDISTHDFNSIYEMNEIKYSNRESNLDILLYPDFLKLHF